MRSNNYLKNLNYSRSASKFNMIYEAIMKDLEIYNDVKPSNNLSIAALNNSKLNLILEEIDKPQYVVCESSGRSILLAI